MNKTIAIIGIVGAFIIGTVFSVDIATAVKPATEVLVTNTDPIPVTGISSSPVCPAENVQHWNKIMFQLRQPVIHPTLPNLIENNFYELLAQVDVRSVADISELVANKLRSFGYTQDNGNPLIEVAMQERDIEYSIICAENRQ